MEYHACARWGYTLAQYRRMTWKEYQYAAELYRHKRELSFEQTRLAVAWIVSNTMGAKKAIKPQEVIHLATIDPAPKVYAPPTKEEMERAAAEGERVAEQLRKLGLI